MAVLGPELVPGSKAYTQTKMIIREMQVSVSPVPRDMSMSFALHATCGDGLSINDWECVYACQQPMRAALLSPLQCVPRMCLGARMWPGSSEDGTSAELERVLYAQMLALFAPQVTAWRVHG